MKTIVLTLFGFFLIILALAAIAAKFWIVGSLITSGVKSFKSECASVYTVEKVFQGNFFCEVRK
jgi:hypothetical protein